VSDQPDNVQPKPDLADVPVKPDSSNDVDAAGANPADPPAEDLTLPTE
jgi:hypothetical protein